MKNKFFYIGLDIGTDSVGYAVTDEEYNLCKFRGEPMWGVTLFDETQTAAERRSFRTARRRLDRRQQRVKLIMELFAREISKVDETFYKRIKESYLYPESKDEKVRLFGSYQEQKEYAEKYPTIHHLIDELMESTEPHDIRLVYIACAWLVAHRGHFLSEVDKTKVDEVTDFKAVYQRLVDYIKHDDYSLPWNEELGLTEIENVLRSGQGISKKSKALIGTLFGKKAPTEINSEYEYNYEAVLKLICGSTVKLKDIFGKDEYEDLEEKSISLGMDDEKLSTIMQSIGDDAELIIVLKAIYDWSVLVDVLKGKDTISKAKVTVYNQHQEDLSNLKGLIKKYANEKYNDVFRSETVKNNYVSYIGSNKTIGKDVNVKKSTNKEDFCKYIKSVLKNVKPDSCDLERLQELNARLETGDFMPKQVDGDNRVIPYQLYWFELNKILENAKSYIPFLTEADEDGITGAEKILSVFEFRVPYFVGPLKENPENNRKLNCWMVRKAKGIIRPWNFNDKVDLDKSENEFIARMTNTCTYLPGEDVLPKNSLVYCAFEVLNEINNIKIDNVEIPVSVKQEIYENVFMQYDKVTPKRIRDYLISNSYMQDDQSLNGLDITVKSSLKSFRMFRNLVNRGLLSYSEVEKIINRATYSEDKVRFKKWLENEFSKLPENEIKYISGLKFKEFGRLSRKFLCGVEGAVNKNTGEYMSIIRAMWETNNNLMQLLSDKFDFSNNIKSIAEEYYNVNKKSLAERLDEMYVSNSVKRPILRTLNILKDIVKVQGHDPEMIFIEMARGADEEQKNKRTKSRLEQIHEFYELVKNDDSRRLSELLDSWGDSAHNKLQSDKLFLYFIQLGKCLYTGHPIDLDSVLSGDGKYNIEHIYPRSFVKDDSIINNKILVESQSNEEKGDKYPIDSAVQTKMGGYWKYLNSISRDKNAKLLSDEKLRRLTRTTPFTEDEKYEFINRQLVETRQSTKVVANLLKEFYPETEIVYVKAEHASDFRQKFDLPKCRIVNDLHHAKDAYLNIVVGNVWHHKFSKKYYLKNADNNAKTEIIFTRTLKCGEKIIWKGVADKDRVVKIASKNTAHLTKYSFCRKGGFFDQMPVAASTGLVPRKSNMPTEIYGGYNKTTASFFVLVRYTIAKKRDVMVMPVELLIADRFLRDDVFAKEYAKKTVGEIVNKPVVDVEFLLNKRILKVNTMLSLDGFRVCITGKSDGGKRLIVTVMNSFKTSIENEVYLKKLESFENKRKKNDNITLNEKFDGISKERNLDLYDCYIEKLQNTQYKYRPANPLGFLTAARSNFICLAIEEQVSVILKIQGLFGRSATADLTAIGGVALAGAAKISSTISNWKKNYTDVRIIDQSASGLFEKVSENLLDLL